MKHRPSYQTGSLPPLQASVSRVAKRACTAKRAPTEYHTGASGNTGCLILLQASAPQSAQPHARPGERTRASPGPLTAGARRSPCSTLAAAVAQLDWQLLHCQRSLAGSLQHDTVQSTEPWLLLSKLWWRQSCAEALMKRGAGLCHTTSWEDGHCLRSIQQSWLALRCLQRPG